MAHSIYYLPGRGGQLSTGLGEALLSRGLDVSGRETRGVFNDLSFTQQIEVIAQDLQNQYWTEGSRVIANSFGAYLFLNAQTLMPPFKGKVLLLSPILGEFSDEAHQRSFIPPHAGKVMELAASCVFPTPVDCQIHVGELDWQSNPESVLRFSRTTGIPATIVPSTGHLLGKQYVSEILDRWL